MPVALNSGRVNEFTLGLIATSRHQSTSWAPWAPHLPKLAFEKPPTKEIAGALEKYLSKNLGYGSTRLGRLGTWNPLNSEQYTGHTAVITRDRGVVSWARGWVPKMAGYWETLVRGGSAPGEWQDDLTMINDPTCISLELKADEALCEELRKYWKEVSDKYKFYSFLGPDRENCNCVRGAVLLLKDFATLHTDRLPGLAQALEKVRDPGQGQMMNLIASGSLLFDSAPAQHSHPVKHAAKQAPSPQLRAKL